MLARLLPEEEVVGLRYLFREMDANCDGVLTLAELRDAVSNKGLSLPDEQVDHLLLIFQFSPCGLFSLYL